MVRFRIEGTEPLEQFRAKGQPVIFAFWHGQILPLVHVHRNQGAVALVSDHSDGEYMARVIQRHGFGLARGSSTRGGVKGLKSALRAARAGKDLGITPDGPKGPRQVFKWGALVAAQLTGHPIIPVAVGANRAWYFNSWDRFMLPKPFSTLTVRYGPPTFVPRDSTESKLGEVALNLEEELKKATLELNPEESRIREDLNAGR